jgi:hypothetical protein
MLKLRIWLTINRLHAYRRLSMGSRLRGNDG